MQCCPRIWSTSLWIPSFFPLNPSLNYWFPLYVMVHFLLIPLEHAWYYLYLDQLWLLPLQSTYYLQLLFWFSTIQSGMLPIQQPASTSVSIPSQTTNGAPLSPESSTSKKIKTRILASTSTSKMLPSLLLDNCTACISFFLWTIRIERRSLMATRLSPTGSLSLNMIREDSSLTIFLLNYPVISQSMSLPSIDNI